MGRRLIPLNYLKCRGFMHAWEEFIPVGKRKAMGDRASFVCVCCGTERHDVYDTYGVIATREYVYPSDGYPGDLPMRDAKVLYLKRVRERREEARYPEEVVPLRLVSGSAPGPPQRW